MLYNRLQCINQVNNQIIMKLGLVLFFTLISILVSGQCHAQCSNIIQNSSFTSSWSNWTKQTGWGITTYGGNSTSATNTIDNSPISGYSLTQTISNVEGTKLFRLDFDAYAGASSGTGTAYLDFYIDSLRFVRLISTSGTTTVTSVLYNNAQSVSTSNWTVNTWKRGFSIYIPWTSSDASVALRTVFISNGSTRDWGIDNISLCRFQTLDLTDVKYAQMLDSIKFQFTKDKGDLVEIYTFDHLTGASKFILSTYDASATIQHISKYYFIKSGSYRKFIGPFELISDDPRKVLSTKQLLGQFTN